MKSLAFFKSFLISVCLVISFFSCQKELEEIPASTSITPATPVPAAPPSSNAAVFTEYLIKSGEQYCSPSPLKFVKVTSMKFTVKFDSSAIYTTKNPSNQGDVNKLYGFADNNGQHHAFSARFGWRWYNNKLNLCGYIYNNSVMEFKEIDNIDIGKPYACAINVAGDKYEFVLNGIVKLTMPRKSATPEGSGYQLYPYFGGDELAPHDVRIWIRDDQ